MKYSVMTVVAALALSASSAFSEELKPVQLEEGHGYTAPSVIPQAWVVSYEMQDEERVRVLESIDGAPTRPGDVVFYELAVVNPSDAPLNNVVLNNDFPAELVLQEGSVSGPAGMEVTYKIVGDEELYALIPAAEEGVEQPSLSLTDVIRVALPEVPANTKVLVTYAGQVRQGTIEPQPLISTEQTQEN